ncbi:family 1 glycosylhydrolase [Erysipelothrix sp. D19-032]
MGCGGFAPQTEGSNLSGGKSLNTWDKWFELSPERFDQNVGPQTTSDVYKLYKEDVQRMRDMNLNSYRTSISWTRLLPDGKTLNQEAVAYYRDYFQTMIDKDIHPIINLFHFDMPWWMMEKGGWTNAKLRTILPSMPKHVSKSLEI